MRSARSGGRVKFAHEPSRFDDVGVFLTVHVF